MNTTRLSLLTLLAALLLASVAGSASAAPGQPPSPTASPAAATGDLLGAARPARARKGMGLPSYRKLLGRRWARKVRRADAAFAARLAPPAGAAARTAAAAPDWTKDDMIGASDALKGRKGRQKRKLKVSTSFEATWSRPWSAWGRDDVTTVVTMGFRAEVHSSLTPGQAARRRREDRQGVGQLAGPDDGLLARPGRPAPAW